MVAIVSRDEDDIQLNSQSFVLCLLLLAEWIGGLAASKADIRLSQTDSPIYTLTQCPLCNAFVQLTAVEFNTSLHVFVLSVIDTCRGTQPSLIYV